MRVDSIVLYVDMICNSSPKVNKLYLSPVASFCYRPIVTTRMRDNSPPLPLQHGNDKGVRYVVQYYFAICYVDHLQDVSFYGLWLYTHDHNCFRLEGPNNCSSKLKIYKKKKKTILSLISNKTQNNKNV